MKFHRMIKALCIIFTLIVFKVACGQDYVVTVTNDTIQGEVKLQNFGPQPSVKVQPLDGKKSSYSILEVRAFRYEGEIYHTVRTSETYQFMKVLQGGYLTLYAFESPAIPQWGGRYLMTIDGRGMEVPNLGFRKKMADYLSDCSDISNAISNGELRKNDINIIVISYN